MSDTYYDRLGVASDASIDEIQAAYREQLTEVHPDVSDDPDASEQTKRLIEAKEVLTDEDERDRYDRIGHERYIEYHGSFVQADGSDLTGAGETVGKTGGETVSGDGERANRTRTASQSTTDEGSWSWEDGFQQTEYPGSRTNEDRAGGSTETGQERRQSQRRNQAWRTRGGDDAYAVGEDLSPLRSRLFPPGPSLVLVFVAFTIYPLLLWAAVLPEFPLFVNVVVAVCLVGVVVFLQSMPSVGATVFGTWTLVLPLGLRWLDVELLSLVGIVAIAGTVLPFGLSLLTLQVLRH